MLGARWVRPGFGALGMVAAQLGHGPPARCMERSGKQERPGQLQGPHGMMLKGYLKVVDFIKKLILGILFCEYLTYIPGPLCYVLSKVR